MNNLINSNDLYMKFLDIILAIYLNLIIIFFSKKEIYVMEK